MNPQTSPPVSYNTGKGKGSLVAIILLIIFLVTSIAFGGWAFSKMQHYKNDSDQISADAVSAAEKVQAAKLTADFAEQSKSPNKQFLGSATYGSISFNYPKTWSAYVDTTNANEPINGFFAPNIVPSTQSKTAFALRIELVQTDYSQVVQQFNQRNTGGTVKLTAVAFLPPQLKGVTNVLPGTLFTGPLNQSDPTQTVNMLAIKVRDKTLEISTQSNDYLKDFNNIILPSLKFAP